MADNLRVVVVVEHVAIEYGMDSIEEGFEHEKTVEKDLGEEDSVCRDPTRYVFDIISIIGSGSHGTVRLCRLQFDLCADASHLL
ncbi:unnamed protein product [Peronospora farinosa]|uniref:Protein kinase domain-containing protein n=1 Tax=Peronospora farinosa TaxID=134698 RepID=A0ABN8C7I2_9STRA|nr:unnamed protein product [Peronospora farinosa]